MRVAVDPLTGLPIIQQAEQKHISISGGGGSSLPSQTGNNGKYLTTNGTAPSWAAIGGGGDMLAATYDPTGKAADAFARANHTGTQAESTVTNLVSDLAAKEPTITAGTTSQYWRGDKSWQTLDKTAVGLANVDNTSDATKNSAVATLTNKTISGSSNTLSNIAESSVTNLVSDLAAKAPIASPTFTGTTTSAAEAITNTNGTLNITSVTDGGDFNIYHTASGAKTLALYGSSSNTLHVNLLDGDLQTGSTTRLTNAGALNNVTFDTAAAGNVLKINGTTVSDKTGTGKVVLDTTPTLVTPVLGVATATSVNKVALTAPAAAATLTIANNKTLTANNSITLAGTDATTMTFPSSTDTVAGLAAVQTITGTWSFNDGKLVLNGATSGTTTLKASAVAGSTTLTLPAATDTLVGRDTTDTLTNKTINGSQLVNTSVSASKLNTGALTATVATQQTTASTSFTDLTTSGAAVTATIGANGLALVSISGSVANSNVGGYSVISYAVSGASTVAASDTNGSYWRAGSALTGATELTLSKTILVTGLTAGSNTFTMKYRVTAGTGTFENRTINVVPL